MHTTEPWAIDRKMGLYIDKQLNGDETKKVIEFSSGCGDLIFLLMICNKKTILFFDKEVTMWV